MIGQLTWSIAAAAPRDSWRHDDDVPAGDLRQLWEVSQSVSPSDWNVASGVKGQVGLIVIHDMRNNNRTTATLRFADCPAFSFSW